MLGVSAGEFAVLVVVAALVLGPRNVAQAIRVVRAGTERLREFSARLRSETSGDGVEREAIQALTSFDLRRYDPRQIVRQAVQEEIEAWMDSARGAPGQTGERAARPREVSPDDGAPAPEEDRAPERRASEHDEVPAPQSRKHDETPARVEGQAAVLEEDQAPAREQDQASAQEEEHDEAPRRERAEDRERTENRLHGGAEDGQHGGAGAADGGGLTVETDASTTGSGALGPDGAAE